MDYKYTGPEKSITLRGVEFKKGKPVPVDDALAQKIERLDYFTPVKGKPKNADKG